MQHPLLQQYPEGVATLKQFSDDHPDILPERRSRHFIQNIASQPELVQRIFRKRFGRWFVHIPSLIAYLEAEGCVQEDAAA